MQHDPEHAEPGLVHPEVAAALGRLAELAHTRQPDEAVLPEFLERYYRELPEPDLDDRRLDALYSVAVAHFGIGRQRRPGETLVRVDLARHRARRVAAAALDPVRRHRRRTVPRRHHAHGRRAAPSRHPSDGASDARRRPRRRRRGDPCRAWRRTDRGVDAGRDRLLRRGGRRRARSRCSRGGRRRPPRRRRLPRDARPDGGARPSTTRS